MRKTASRLLTALLATTAFTSVAKAQDADQSDFSITDEIIVRGVNIPDEKRATSEISSVLTPERLERQGDSDIAAALRRVTGLSLSQGKFIVVRGLNERYSSLTLNGSPLPSPEPLRRVAPLDLFPTSVVETALVQKTFSPEFSAEFGGGLIELRSKGVPDENFLTISLSTELDTATTASDGLTYDGGDLDWLGFDDGTRSVPDALQNAIDEFPGVVIRTEGGIPSSQIREIGASLVNSELRVVQENSTPVNSGVNVSGGWRRDLDNMSLGFVSSLGYDRSFQTKEGQQGTAEIGQNPGEVAGGDSFFDFTSTTEEVLLNGLLSVGAEIGDNHEITLTGLILRKTQKEARIREGADNSSIEGELVQFVNTEFFENQVYTGQFRSEHVFPELSDLTVTTRASYSEAFRDAPYETQYGYTFDTNAGQFRSLIGDQGGRSFSASQFATNFSRVDDQSVGAGIDFVLPVDLADIPIDLKAGYAYTDNERDYVFRQFGFVNETGLPNTDPLFFQRIDFLLSDQNIGESGGFEFVEQPDGVSTPGAYTGELTVHGAYFGLDAEITPFIRAAAGFRFETGEQTVDNFFVAAFEPIPNTEVDSVIDEDYFLPAVTLTWNPIENVQVRAGFSQTITRPQFQELGAAVFTDTDRDIQVFGNPFLQNTETNNFDVRFEYYFGREQFITIGGFYKDITNPIEESLFSSGNNINTTYINAPSAELYGLEFEYEQRFFMDDIVNWPWFQGKDLLISANYTWSQSEVSNDGEVTVPTFLGQQLTPITDSGEEFFVDGRALQGQSDHIVNGQIGFEDPEIGSRLFLLVNWTSERIRQVGLIQGAKRA